MSAKAKGKGSMWIVFALLSAVPAAVTSILAKIGIGGSEQQPCHGYPHRRGAGDGVGDRFRDRNGRRIGQIGARSWCS